ncbi:MAG: aminotransferase class V-fold PLP-dependent enzyme [Pseudomonadota bacterium]|nr:aminotransferase class V-fold PLP-dependent enzyme [Pseudomonadota bacterium]
MDRSFTIDEDGLRYALDALRGEITFQDANLPDALPEVGIGQMATIERLAPHILGGASVHAHPSWFAHMDPPTPWITWATSLWNAAANQNLLHAETAPVAREIEERVVAWLAPAYGMDGGHMTPGSTVANLTALWAARERMGVTEVVTSEAAHISIAKSAALLGLRLISVPTDRSGRIDPDAVPVDLSSAALVLTAGTTAVGAIDPLDAVRHAAWLHVDAAWAGPLRLSPRHAPLLDGIDHADSVAISGHKLLFQPKESGLVLFRETAASHAVVSSGAPYLASPNVGLLGSHGASAVPLLATLLSWGREGLAQRLDRCVEAAEVLGRFVDAHPLLELFAPPNCGVVAWRPRDAALLQPIVGALGPGSVSTALIDGELWLRNVAANPEVDPALLINALATFLAGDRTG